MNDTTFAVERRFEQMLMLRKPEERLRRGCSMFMTAKQIVKNSIKEKFPHTTPKEMKKLLFLRFYEQEFNEISKKSILDSLN